MGNQRPRRLRIWPFIPRPFHNLWNRFWENFVYRKIFEWRERTGRPYRDRELVYAARHVCRCGAGLAYPRGCGPHHYWACSRVLTGRPGPPYDSRVHDAVDFISSKIKSERQPSARGATTRPRRDG